MRWRNPRRSENIEDRRGMRIPMKAIGGGIGGLILLIITLLLSGGDPGTIFSMITPTLASIHLVHHTMMGRHLFPKKRGNLPILCPLSLQTLRTPGMKYSLLKT